MIDQDCDESIKQRLAGMNINAKSPDVVDNQLALMKSALLAGNVKTYEKLVEENGFDVNLTRISRHGLESESDEDEFAAEIAALESGDESESQLNIVAVVNDDDEADIKVDDDLNQITEDAVSVGTTEPTVDTVAITVATVASSVNKVASAVIPSGTVSDAIENFKTVTRTALPLPHAQETVVAANTMTAESISITEQRSQLWSNSESWTSSEVDASMQLTLASVADTTNDSASDAPSSSTTAPVIYHMAFDDDAILLNYEELELNYEELMCSAGPSTSTAQVYNEQTYNMASVGNALSADAGSTARCSMFGDGLSPPTASAAAGGTLPTEVGVVDTDGCRHNDIVDDDDDIIFLDAFTPPPASTTVEQQPARQSSPDVVQIDDDDEPPVVNGQFIPVINRTAFERRRVNHLRDTNQNNKPHRVISTIVPNDQKANDQRRDRHLPVIPPLRSIFINGDYLANNMSIPPPQIDTTPPREFSNNRNVRQSFTPHRYDRDHSFSRHHAYGRRSRHASGRKQTGFNEANDGGAMTWQQQPFQNNFGGNSNRQRSRSCMPPSDKRNEQATNNFDQSLNRFEPSQRFRRLHTNGAISDDANYRQSSHNGQYRQRSRSTIRQERNDYENDFSHRTRHWNETSHTTGYNCRPYYNDDNNYNTNNNNRQRNRSKSRDRNFHQYNNRNRHNHFTQNPYLNERPPRRATGMTYVQQSMALFTERKRKIEIDQEFMAPHYKRQNGEPPQRRFRNDHNLRIATTSTSSSQVYYGPLQNHYANGSSSEDSRYQRRQSRHQSRGRRHSRHSRHSSRHIRQHKRDASSSSRATYSPSPCSDQSRSSESSASRSLSMLAVTLKAIERHKHKSRYRIRSRSRVERTSDDGDKVTFSKKELKSFIHHIIQANNKTLHPQQNQ